MSMEDRFNYKGIVKEDIIPLSLYSTIDFVTHAKDRLKGCHEDKTIAKIVEFKGKTLQAVICSFF